MRYTGKTPTKFSSMSWSSSSFRAFSIYRINIPFIIFSRTNFLQHFLLRSLQRLIPGTFLMFCLWPFLPYLYRSGVCLILSSIRFLPRSELMALEPMMMPFVTAPDVCKFLPSLRAVPSSPLYFGVFTFSFLSWSYYLISFDSYVRR